MFRIAVLVSGTGTTLEAILKDAQDHEDYEVALVIGDRPCMALEKAKERGYNTLLLSRDVSLSHRVKEACAHVDLVVLAGFLSILEGDLLQAKEEKIINLHPSLLPQFGGKGMYGFKVHEKVFESGQPFSGCTVHYVNDVVDGGSFLLKRMISIEDCRSPEDVMKKVAAVEKGALLDAIHLLVKEAKDESTDQCF